MKQGSVESMIRSCRSRDTRALFEGRQPARSRSKSLKTTELMLVPPGEVLLEEFFKPMGISQYRLALVL